MSNGVHTPNEPSAPPSGLRTLGKYELIALIGEGGMAEVYLARQRGPMNFEKIVVVKLIHQHLARKPKFIKMLLDEARIAALLKHPSVVDIYDLGVQDGTYFIAMEHLAGEAMLAVLRAGVKRKALDIPSTARIIADVADGLHAAHELVDTSGKPLELVHRDITPGNIIVQYSGQVKIVDFGIAKARGRLADETDADHFKGKLGYISPEQVKGKPADRRADIFSLGVVMWEALALRRLFRKDNPAAAAEAILKTTVPPPSKYRSTVPSKLDSICLRAIARDPGERYATAAEMNEDIERFLAAGSFRPHKATIRQYMQEMFGENIKEREELLKRVASATTELRVSPALTSTGRSSDSDLPVFATGPVPKMDPSLLDSSAYEERTPPGVGQLSSPSMIVPLMGLPPPPMRRSRRKLWLGVGVGSLVLMLIVAALSSSASEETSASSATVSVNDGDASDTTDDTHPSGTRPDESHTQIDAMVADAGVPDTGTSLAIDAAVPVDASAEVADAKLDKPKKKPRGNPVTLYKQGIQLFAKGKLSSARVQFKRALAIKPSYAPAYRGLGMVYQRQGKNKRAAASFRKYLKLAPKNARDRKSIQKRLKAVER